MRRSFVLRRKSKPAWCPMKMKTVILAFPLPGLSEAEEERIELAIAECAAAIFEQTGLYILCAVLDSTTRE